MSENSFANEFITRLDGRVPDSVLGIILDELQIFLADYDVKKKSTEIAVCTELPDAYKVYMVTKKIEGRSTDTLKLYKVYLEQMFYDIGKPLEKIEANDIRLHLHRIQSERKISDRTLNCRRVIIHGFFAWCVTERYIGYNPCATVRPIKYEKKPRQPLSDVEMEQLRDSCKTLREKAIMEVLYATGCRCQELCNLKKEDVDLTTREVRLFGKGKKHRVSYLNARAKVALEKYLEARSDDEPWLFVTVKKPYRQIHNEVPERIMRQVGERSDIPSVFPHRMRHTFATDALNHGMPVTDLQELLGHDNIDTTMIYAKANKTSISYNHSRYVI